VTQYGIDRQPIRSRFWEYLYPLPNPQRLAAVKQN
jgi:hypothetical protein